MILRPVMPDDDLAPGDAGVAGGAADDEAPGGVDVQLGGVAEEAGGGELLADDLADGRVDGVLVDAVEGLVGADDVGDGLGLAAVVEDGDLGLGVGAEPGDGFVAAEPGQAAEDAVGADEGEGEVLGGLVGGVAEHHALVAGALLLGVAAVDALVDVGRLGVEIVDVGEVLPAEPLLGAVVADVLDDALGDGLGVELLEAVAGDLAEVHHQVHAAGGLAGDVGVRVEGEAGVEDGVGDGVGHLVGMPLGDGFGGVDVSGGKLAHDGSCSLKDGANYSTFLPMWHRLLVR